MKTKISCTLFKKRNTKISILKKIINPFTNPFINPYMNCIWNVCNEQRNNNASDNITKLNKEYKKIKKIKKKSEIIIQ